MSIQQINEIVAPMPGKVLCVKVKEGEKVTKDDVLIILEAMKMENEILAETDGVVGEVIANVGDFKQVGEKLLDIIAVQNNGNLKT